MERTGFKDRTAIKKETPKNTPAEGKNSPWDFRQPDYDERSSCYVKAGTDYGLCHRQPVGTDKHNPKPYIPMGRVSTMKTDEV
jgi:hypothetical protein